MLFLCIIYFKFYVYIFPFLVVSHKANPEEARNFETANRYHFFHTFALFGVPFCRFPKIVITF